MSGLSPSPADDIVGVLQGLLGQKVTWGPPMMTGMPMPRTLSAMA